MGRVRQVRTSHTSVFGNKRGTFDPVDIATKISEELLLVLQGQLILNLITGEVHLRGHHGEDNIGRCTTSARAKTKREMLALPAAD